MCEVRDFFSFQVVQLFCQFCALLYFVLKKGAVLLLKFRAFLLTHHF